MDAGIILVRQLPQQQQQHPPQADSGAEQFLKLVQDPFKTAFQANAFWASLGTSVGITIFIAICFSLLRPFNSVVYAPKLKHADEKHRPPPVGKGVFAWVTPLVKTREAQLIEKVGLDATIFLRFTRMCRNLFLIMAIVGCGVMIPANVASSNRDLTHSAFVTMTPLNVWGRALWAHVICAWAFDILVAYFLWTNYRAVVRLRRQYFESSEYQAGLHSRTLMITDIPGSFRTDEGIARITNELNSSAGAPRCAIGRNVKELPNLIEQHAATVRKLESYLAKFLKNPDRLGPRPTCQPDKKDRSYTQGQSVDAIEYLSGRIRDLEIEIHQVRLSVDKRNAMPYGFASYQSIPEAHNVALAARRKHPHGTTVSLAPRPNDLIWENLPLSKKTRRWRRFSNNLWVALLTVVWIAPNAMMAIFLTNLSNLGLVWPAFQHKQLEAYPKTWAVVQGIASPALTSLVYLLLPIIFRRLSVRAGDLTKTDRDQNVTHKLYAFFVFNYLIIFSAFSAIWQFAAGVVNAEHHNKGVWDAIKEGQFFVKIMTALCTVSPYWVTWLLQRNLGAATDLSQIFNLIYVNFCRAFMNPTPRQFIEWTAPPWFDYAAYYNYFLFYATVALCFATLQPIVLAVTALYFALDSWLKKYLLMYVFITKTESGGQIWRILYNRIVFAAILANVFVGLVLKAKGSDMMLYCLVPLPFLMLGFKWYCSKAFDDEIHFYTKATLKDPESLPSQGKESHRNDKLAMRFGHPALHKSLITPMVHAKAQHVLAQVYRGRLNSDHAGDVDEYRDIQLGQMSQTRPGKSQGQAPKAPFEIVPENQLDFAYYKNREEFGDEHGGGDIYGKPSDLVTLRSQTPRSFFGPTASPASSRASSPSGYGSRRLVSDHDSNGVTYPVDYHHPTYRTASPDSPRMISNHMHYRDPANSDFYSHTNESESRLLSGAAAVPVGAPGYRDDYGQHQIGTPHGEAEDPLNYDYYRRGRR